MKEEAKSPSKKPLSLLEVLAENETKLSNRITCMQAKNKTYFKVIQFSYLMMNNKEKAERVRKRIEERQNNPKTSR